MVEQMHGRMKEMMYTTLSTYHERSTNVDLQQAINFALHQKFYKKSLYIERSTNVALPRAFYKCLSTTSILRISLSVELHFVLQVKPQYSGKYQVSKLYASTPNWNYNKLAQTTVVGGDFA